jgi:hypothetical protein
MDFMVFTPFFHVLLQLLITLLGLQLGVVCPESGHIFSIPFFVGWGHLCLASAVRILQIKNLTSVGCGA